MWRLARSLETLRAQVDRLAPARSRVRDGTIGDAAHAARVSDHNPNSAGVVQALDITHDPDGGFDSYAFAEWLRLQRDARIKYIISNGRIVSSTVSPWTWRPYSGADSHDKHVHISVNNPTARYDDPSEWSLGFARVDLRMGSRGAHVAEVQTLLGLEPADGVFGEATDAAVRAYQSAHGLVVDGIVGERTLAALRGTTPSLRQRDITATMFGGAGDRQTSAYDGHTIGDSELGVALPWRFPGNRPHVRVIHAGRSVVGAINDVGPWNTDDPYWTTGGRPQAESGYDTRGRRTNRAGIDLTPAMAKAIGLAGKGLVDWEFVGEDNPTQSAPPPAQPPSANDTAVLASIIAAVLPIIERDYVVLTKEQLAELIHLARTTSK